MRKTGGTLTSEGFIPYYRLGSLMLPVKLDIPKRLPVADIKRPQPPLRRKGYLVFVLPGGGEYESPFKQPVTE
jgi:hypothetical protein